MKNTQFLAPKWRAYVTPYEAGFSFGNGVVVGSLWELKQALLTLEEGLVANYIKKDNHHVANWVRQVVGDDQLADQLAMQGQRWGVLVALERQMMRTLNLPDYVAKRWMGKAKHQFEFVSGEKIWNLQDLNKTIGSISDDSLSFHYQRFPNDLTVWLSDVIGDYYLADSLEEANSKDQVAKIIEDHVDMLEEAIS